MISAGKSLAGLCTWQVQYRATVYPTMITQTAILNRIHHNRKISNGTMYLAGYTWTHSSNIMYYYLIPFINVIGYFLLFSEILKRSIWPVNGFDCFPSVLWCHRVIVLNCWLVNSFDCFPRTLWHHNCKIKKFDFYHTCKNYWLVSFSWIAQVIKQLFHIWEQSNTCPSVSVYGLGQQFKTLSPPPWANSLTVPKSHMK